MMHPARIARIVPPRLAVALVFGAAALLTARVLVGAPSPLRQVGPSLEVAMMPLRFDDAAQRVHFNTRARGWAELAVVVLQVAAVGLFGLSHLSPRSRWADLGRAGFTAAMVGLGVAGTLCAAYGSAFALFAGGAMAVLLNLVILNDGAHHHRPADARRGAGRAA